jgi:serine/threonine protein kinase
VLAGALCRIHNYYGPKRQPTDSTISSPDTTTTQQAPPAPKKSANAPNSQEGKLYGRHGDIKPPNVLWFQDENDPNGLGILKLTDFGVTEVHSTKSRSNGKRGDEVAYTPSYRPPECDVHGVYVNQAYDIWTLGCLYLEFITWLLGGWTLVDEFGKERLENPIKNSPFLVAGLEEDTFFYLFKCSKTGLTSAGVKPCVTEVGSNNWDPLT